MILTCRQVTELIYDFVSGELTAEVTQHCRFHLDGCPSCLTLVNSYRVIVQASRKLPLRPMPATLEARLNDLLNQMQGNAPPPGGGG
jgi:anti-sigma factor RsiW